MKENRNDKINSKNLTTKEKFYLGAFLKSYKCAGTQILCIVNEKSELPITVYDDWSNQIIYELCKNNILIFAKISKSDCSVRSYLVNVKYQDGDDSFFTELENITISEMNIAEIIEILHEDISYHLAEILDDAFGEDKRSSNIERLDILIRIGEILAHPITSSYTYSNFDSFRKDIIKKVNFYYDEIYAIINDLRSSGIVINVIDNSYTSLIHKIINRDKSSKF